MKSALMTRPALIKNVPTPVLREFVCLILNVMFKITVRFVHAKTVSLETHIQDVTRLAADQIVNVNLQKLVSIKNVLIHANLLIVE